MEQPQSDRGVPVSNFSAAAMHLYLIGGSGAGIRLATTSSDGQLIHQTVRAFSGSKAIDWSRVGIAMWRRGEYQFVRFGFVVAADIEQTIAGCPELMTRTALQPSRRMICGEPEGEPR